MTRMVTARHGTDKPWDGKQRPGRSKCRRRGWPTTRQPSLGRNLVPASIRENSVEDAPHRAWMKCLGLKLGLVRSPSLVSSGRLLGNHQTGNKEAGLLGVRPSQVPEFCPVQNSDSEFWISAHRVRQVVIPRASPCGRFHGVSRGRDSSSRSGVVPADLGLAWVGFGIGVG